MVLAFVRTTALQRLQSFMLLLLQHLHLAFLFDDDDGLI